MEFEIGPRTVEIKKRRILTASVKQQVAILVAIGARSQAVTKTSCSMARHLLGKYLRSKPFILTVQDTIRPGMETSYLK